jgi:hypothetical protein
MIQKNEYLDSIEIVYKYYEQLGLQNVISRLKCIYGSTESSRTSNNLYYKIKSNEKYYLIIDDNGEATWHKKEFFNEI